MRSARPARPRSRVATPSATPQRFQDFTKDFKISRRFQDFTKDFTKISRFHKDFKISKKISRFHEDFKISKKISRFQLRFQLWCTRFQQVADPSPVLVVERLQGSLDEFLESTPDITLPIKLSVLQDVAQGLVYLHNYSPAIIHRDLTARNVLLNSAMKAKIADLGNSRMVDIPLDQLARTTTQGIPGTLVYMPPEVSDEEHKYGPSLDMFSFGTPIPLHCHSGGVCVWRTLLSR